MYTFNSRVRYSETDETGCLSLLGMMNYMQDCSTFQSEDAGVGVGFLEKHHKAWLLSSWQIEIDRYPKLGERILVGTWPTATRGMYGYRAFVLRDASGGSLVRAQSVWFLFDTQKQIPLRVQPEDIDPYGAAKPPLPMRGGEGRLRLPRTCRDGMPVTVARHHLDTNHHMNNAQYVSLARDAVPASGIVCGVRADYKKAALLGERLVPRLSQMEQDLWIVGLQGEDGQLRAVIELRMMDETEENEEQKK